MHDPCDNHDGAFDTGGARISVNLSPEDQIKKLRGELAEIKVSYNRLDQNWMHVHNTAMDRIRHALGLPINASLPDMEKKIARLMRGAKG